MSRVQLALRVPDLAASIAFYTKLFGTEPAKLRDGYANFAVTEPPLKLVLIEGVAGEATRMDHLGVEVETTEAVHTATARLAEAGLATVEENDTTCCYALQDKVWVHGPGQEPWEVYVVKADADSLAKQQGGTCCTGPGEDDGLIGKLLLTVGNQRDGPGGTCGRGRPSHAEATTSPAMTWGGLGSSDARLSRTKSAALAIDSSAPAWSWKTLVETITPSPASIQ
jgi:catechol 2,3-dioxygenase-like lactoylglutathione lyase family enzyme